MNQTSTNLSQSFKPLSFWTEQEVINWMKGLDSCLLEHIPQFQAHCINGEDICKLDQTKLKFLQVTQIGHQELFLEAVELLRSLDNSIYQQTSLRKVRQLSKKASQLVQLTSSPFSKSSSYSKSLEVAASVMEASRQLITWIDDNPNHLVEDYNSFRLTVLQTSLSIKDAVALEADACRLDLMENGKLLVKLTSALIAPENANGMVDGVIVIDVILRPDLKGLGFTLRKLTAGLLQVTHVQQGGPADLSGRVFAGDEVIQVNKQNVVGWEIAKVIECLKENLYEVELTLKSNTSRTPPIERKGFKSAMHNPSSTPGSPLSTSRNFRFPNRHTAPHQVNYVETYRNEGQAPPPPRVLMNGHPPLRATKSFDVDTKVVEIPLREKVGKRRSLGNTQRLKSHSLNLEEELAEHRESVLSSTSVDIPVFQENEVVEGSSGGEEYPDVGKVRQLQVDRQERAMSVPPKGSPNQKKLKPPRQHMMSNLDPQKPIQSCSTGDIPSASSMCYKTKIIGGVVHKIPLTSQEGSPASSPLPEKKHELVFKTVVVGGVVMKIPVDKSGKQSENRAILTSSPGKKKAKVLDEKPPQYIINQGANEFRHDLSSENMSTAVEMTDGNVHGKRGSLFGGSDIGEDITAHKVVFSSPRDVTISGQVTKEVEVESQIETIAQQRRPSKKHDTPLLQVPCFQLKDVDHEGWLNKLGGSGLTPRNWRRRWFVLKGGNLYYYKTAYDVSALGLVKLNGYSLQATQDSKKKFAFQLSKEGERTYYFIADTAEDMSKWMSLLESAALDSESESSSPEANGH